MPVSRNKWMGLAPGLLLSVAITVISLGIGELEEHFFDHAVLEPLVLALLLGLLVRNLWTPPASFNAGISFAGKQVLELAIVILGLTLNLRDILDAGWDILLSVVLLISMTLIIGTTVGRFLGLGTRLSILVAVGNAICGNSAIAAVAPAIKAKKEEVAAAIALTAVFGVGVVLALPLLVPLLDLSDRRYGVVAGLSVYAVPQVLAATFTVSTQSGQIGSLVKLTRVMFLGPVVALFAFLYREKSDASSGPTFQLSKFLPWFVIGFAICAALRTGGAIPDNVKDIATETSRLMTAVAMAGLGLGVDIRSIKSTGPKVITLVLILTVILVISALLVTRVLGIN